MTIVDREMKIAELMDGMQDIIDRAEAQERDLSMLELAEYDVMAVRLADLRDGEGE